MARARNIKPALFKNELLGVADPLLTLLFQSLWTLADREGILEDRPLRIKAETFPYRDNLDVNGYLTELQRLGFVVRYSVGSLDLIQVVNFKKHQTPHSTEKASELPAPIHNIQLNHSDKAVTVRQPLSDGENVVALPPDLLIPDSLIPSTLISDSLIPETGFPSKDLSPPTASTKPKNGTRLPEDWALPKAWGEWAMTEKPAWTKDDVRRAADDFRDYWIANSNRPTAKKADWLATWRIWVRKEFNSKPGNFKTTAEKRSENTDRAIAEFLGESGNTIEGEVINDRL